LIVSPRSLNVVGWSSDRRSCCWGAAVKHDFSFQTLKFSESRAHCGRAAMSGDAMNQSELPKNRHVSPRATAENPRAELIDLDAPGDHAYIGVGSA
jgi:hypothetical protein